MKCHTSRNHNIPEYKSTILPLSSFKSENNILEMENKNFEENPVLTNINPPLHAHTTFRTKRQDG